MNNTTALKVLDQLLASTFFNYETDQALKRARELVFSAAAAEQVNRLAREGTSVVRCENCLRLFFERECAEVADFSSRVSPGEICPVCDCPICGAVCHYTLLPAEDAKRQRYVIAEYWEHLKLDNTPWHIRWVYDRWNAELVTAQQVIGTASWHGLNASALKDIDDHIANANPEALEHSLDWGLETDDTLPKWAQFEAVADYNA